MIRLSKIFFFFLLAIITNSQSFQIMPYYMPLNYKDSGVRENSTLMGIYTAWEADLNHKFEFAVDYSDLKYIYAFQLDQYDVTFVYSNFSLPTWGFRIGGHYISSDDALTDKSFVIFGGISKSRFRSWDASIDAYWSSYADYSPNFSVIQIQPKFGLTFMLARSAGLHLSSQVDYISLSKNIFSDKKNFFSVRETLTYFHDKFSVSVYGVFGEQMFAVRQKGFLVFNVADLLKNGFGASITYSFTDKFFVKTGFEYDNFYEDAYGTNAKLTKLIFLARINF